MLYLIECNNNLLDIASQTMLNTRGNYIFTSLPGSLVAAATACLLKGEMQYSKIAN